MFSPPRKASRNATPSLRDDFVRRTSALYVDKSDDGSPKPPQECVSKESAVQMIDKVHKHLASILNAEWLNSPKIGAKALLK